MLKGCGRTSFRVILIWEHDVLAILKGGGGGAAKSLLPLKLGGGGANGFTLSLGGGGGGLPLTDRSLTLFSLITRAEVQEVIHRWNYQLYFSCRKRH